MMRDRLDHLPQSMQQELHCLTAILIEAFGEALTRNFASANTPCPASPVIHGGHHVS